ncbi:MAG TPA: S9 family peptidase [Brevundimonas sp.]|uniref:S9 family peptidase n=1 Tax=Brevundimonas sp. TaxID=1871086 RepID=UPI002C740F53|nr:S9 family peptidase [Brevundimonas sp.]HRH19333.1 S9 family peptidase [Brevundimonas sp.]
MRHATAVSILALLAAAPAGIAVAQDGHAGHADHAAHAAHAAHASHQHQTYTAAQFFETTSVSLSTAGGYAFSPDGSHVLMNSDATGVFNVYAQPIDGSAPVALTQSTDNATFAASYFPNDGRVLFTHDQGGDERDHVYVRNEDGTVVDLTPGEGLKADFLGWSADGQTLYLTSNGRNAEAFDILAFDTTSLQGRVLFENPGGFFPSSVSPDGRWVVIDKPNTSADSDIFLVDLQGTGEPVLITEHEGDIAYGSQGFTPDGTALIFGTNEHGEWNQAWRRDLATGAVTPLIQADWDVMYVGYSWSGRYRVHALNADASTDVTITDTTTGSTVTLSGVPAGDLGNIRFNDDETTLAFSVVSDTSPADIFVADLATGEARRLTHTLNPQIDESHLVEATIVRYAGEGGVMIPGVLYRPHGASAEAPVPAIVFVHGGPGGQSRRGYSAMVQHLVNHGYAVLLANNRGSSGYGKTFFHMDDRAHGEADLRDIVAGGQWLRDQDWVADDQVAVMGGSYGGYMTAAALAFHPEAFEAGINIFGVTNWVRTLESIPAWWGAQRDALYDEMGDPATDAERHRAISPLFHAGNIVRPMLVIQGANDPRVLQVESDELVAAARANGTPVDYVLFPDEGHGFLRRENRITAQEAYLRFLNQYVRDLPQ